MIITNLNSILSFSSFLEAAVWFWIELSIWDVDLKNQSNNFALWVISWSRSMVYHKVLISIFETNDSIVIEKRNIQFDHSQVNEIYNIHP